jgi:hypothetical protein
MLQDIHNALILTFLQCANLELLTTDGGMTSILRL